MTKRGGKRSGAGRKKNSGKFGLKTKTIRVPENMVDDIQEYIYKKLKKVL